MFLPAVIKPTAPAKPIMMPNAFTHLVLKWKNDTPNNKVKSGVSEFNIPAKELLMPVSALVKRKAGIKLPNAPAPRKAFQCFIKSFLI